MTKPDHITETSSSGKYNLSIGSSLPVWQRLSGYILERNGWKKIGNEYHKDNFVLQYNGVKWSIGTITFNWIEELNKYLNNGKLPEE